MGNRSSKSKVVSDQSAHKLRIKIATLNYGVTDCPFEYSTLSDGADPDLEQKVLEDLNERFEQIFRKELGFNVDDHMWGLGKLEKKYKAKRYSPLYYPQVGIERMNFLMDYQQFQAKWHSLFQEFKDKNLEK